MSDKFNNKCFILIYFKKGRREIQLLMNKNNGSADGSVVNFACNPYYELIGKKSIKCTNGTWDTDIPKCSMTDRVCRKKPPMKIGSAQMVGLKSILVKNEYTLSYFSNAIRFYTVASYTCAGNKFSKTSLVKYKKIKDHNIGYVDYACIGKDEWEVVTCG